ncbi:aminoglycoside phosphotransferase family protein [Amycolatopsis echigonensis]|uniref:Aminoglycoside phosphotransferase family protein n=1 Tax=Amycolatopsis echigonensis TaxID=2576905 RepID=A0A2N3WEC3_9PSEU|nr:aminoglycoside phosphotransferase family protein [Amycolatopsis echigonensis]PKV92201.1 Ser/Thr protein kinase RdoA (MazF antagonist) [Amycolatopsis niigatensis]
MSPAAALTEESAREVLGTACTLVGFESSDAELIRLGSNAVFRIPGRVIARISRDPEARGGADRQVAVARWLAGEGYPANRALDVRQPVEVGGYAVTFWESAAEDERYAPVRDVARLIRELHELHAPAELDLPEKRPFAELNARMADLENIDPGDAEFIRNRIDELASDYDNLEFTLPFGVIHGDANVGNVILDREGNPILIDLDSFGIGPREWDLVQTALFYERFGWHTEDEYRTFVDVYGFDVMDWYGYPVLADYRELSMTLWLCGKAAGNDAAVAEVRKRVASLRDGGTRRDWAPF